MNKKILLLCILLFLISYVQAQTNYYTFDESSGLIRDRIGVLDFYSISNILYSQSGFVNNSIYLNNSQLLTDDTIFPTNFTVSFWAKRSIYDANYRTILDSGVTNGINIYFWSNRTYIGNKTTSVFGGINGYINTWQFYTITSNGSYVKLYLNGSLIAQDNLLISHSLNPIKLGNTTTPLYFNGYIDELKIYNTILTSSQIAYQYYNYTTITTTSTTSTTSPSTTTTTQPDSYNETHIKFDVGLNTTAYKIKLCNNSECNYYNVNKEYNISPASDYNAYLMFNQLLPYGENRDNWFLVFKDYLAEYNVAVSLILFGFVIFILWFILKLIL
jgi:hypothetical protein